MNAPPSSTSALAAPDALAASEPPLGGASAGDAPYSPQAIHLLRTVTGVNMSLSQMADQKASMLMGATFVVFTISVSQASRGNFPLSLMLLALFAFVSAMFAIAAVVPKIGGVNRAAPSANVLFFGVFAQLDEQTFINRVLDELGDDARIYRLMLRDIHQNGRVLQRKKYRFLSYAYRIFQVGLCVTLAMFLYESRTLIGHML